MPQAVVPKVRLIVRPQVDWDEVFAYLQEIGGERWFERLPEAYGRQPSDGEAMIEFAGRYCYRSWLPGLNINVTKIREDSELYFSNLLESGHGSVLEHANYTFVLQNVSRVFTHEMVRHRAGAAYSQESMRYVRLDRIPFWLPEWAQEDDELCSRIWEVLNDLEKFQGWMANHFALDADNVPFHEKKAKTSFMRRFAPDGVATGMVATFNVRAIRHIVATRTDPAAEEEIRLVFDMVANKMKEEAPFLFQDFIDVDGTWTPQFRKV